MSSRLNPKHPVVCNLCNKPLVAVRAVLLATSHCLFHCLGHYLLSPRKPNSRRRVLQPGEAMRHHLSKVKPPGVQIGIGTYYCMGNVNPRCEETSQSSRCHPTPNDILLKDTSYYTSLINADPFCNYLASNFEGILYWP
jgi:hypothetical protein